jgi:integrase
MASFQKRGNTWQYTVSAKPKNIRKGGFKTKKEAQIAAAQIEGNLSKSVIKSLKPQPFDQYFDNWVKLYKTNISESTKSHYNDTLNVIKDYFANVPIQDITRNDYQLFINQYGSKRAKETVDKLNRHIRSCVKDAVEDMIIPFDFTRKVTLTYKVESKRPDQKHLNYEESKKLKKLVLERLDQGLGYYIIFLALVTGMRFSEIVGLTRKDFDFKNNIINVDKTWNYKFDDPRFAPTKNHEVRKIKINKVTMDLFKPLVKKSTLNINNLVFYSPNSRHQVITNTNVNKLLRSILSELKLKDLTIHGLRHTHASVLLYKKVSINYISERLGHKNLETTWKTYAHILKEMRKEDEDNTIKILDELLV